ncbi:MAG: LysR family transcriptional regulator [Pseudomonadota bacterium]|nr:MAG: LysR family transcriptional regulator [Pseudomonadota bacterium]
MSTPRVTLDQWRTLQAVVDYGGYAQAAQQLHRSQSSVSYAISRLQEQLGVALLRVEGRKAQLTEAGEALLLRSRPLVQAAVELEQLAHSLGQGWEPEVRLVVDAAFPTGLLMQALRRFEPLCPNTTVQLSEVVLTGADEALEEGRADLAVGERVPSRFLGDPLIGIEFVAVAAPDHPLHGLGREVALGDLERERQVIVRDSGMRRQRDTGWLGAEQRWTVSSIDSAVAAVCAGLGFAWLPRHAIAAQLRDGALAPVALGKGQVYRAQLFLVYGQHNPGPAVRQLAGLLEDLAGAERLEKAKPRRGGN